ncbi:hypothetical protein SAMN05421678_110168 [Actinopolymorpha cephalotaxi]|uniref:Cell division protein FtsL n=1 Tax=Actinopolymorpha cephalotaxi TaxID=504797 RepID=A0A1I2W9N8_9ACTN|nr:hypothetical protein [Actinopolymorpha cephalotaxi]NYH82679.1 hypothetical protein [Actinopolymorpha cephalotaxi]SFG98124.1 hypothetical protein SAMN05421678_110168 [Actinopolymorpha cephalotaxi]
MSALESLNRPVREAAPRPRLRVVPKPEPQQSRAPFVILVVAILGAGLLGLLLLNTTVQQGSFTIHDLSRRTTLLEDRQAALEQQVAVMRAPEHLAGQAERLGMVPNTNPVFLRLRDGAVLGDAVPAKARQTPAPAPSARVGDSVPPQVSAGRPGTQTGTPPGAQPGQGTTQTDPGTAGTTAGQDNPQAGTDEPRAGQPQTRRPSGSAPLVTLEPPTSGGGDQ